MFPTLALGCIDGYRLAGMDGPRRRSNAELDTVLGDQPPPTVHAVFIQLAELNSNLERANELLRTIQHAMFVVVAMLGLIAWGLW